MTEPDFLRFASDATIAALWGGVCLAVAAVALLGERRRRRRRHIDQVGWVPWSTISIAASFGSVILLAMAAKGWIAG